MTDYTPPTVYLLHNAGWGGGVLGVYATREAAERDGERLVAADYGKPLPHPDSWPGHLIEEWPKGWVALDVDKYSIEETPLHGAAEVMLDD